MTQTQANAKDFNTIKSRLTRSLNDTLMGDCNPPPDELHIPYGSVVPDEEAPGWAFARVIYVVYCPKKKTHTVDLRFQYDKFGKFILSSMQYV
jgi:hypothetical protein